MNLTNCTKAELGAFVEKHKDRLTKSSVSICFPQMLVWYDKHEEVGSIESIVATHDLCEACGLMEKDTFRIVEGGELK